MDINRSYMKANLRDYYGNQLYRFYRGDATEYARRQSDWDSVCHSQGMNDPRDISRFNQNRVNLNTIDHTARKCKFHCNECQNKTEGNLLSDYSCNICKICLNNKPKYDINKLTSAVTINNGECTGYGCSPEVCELWNKQMNAYVECQKIKTQEECRKQFGCKQWEYSRYRYTAPLSPRLTNCEPCWINNYTNI